MYYVRSVKRITLNGGVGSDNAINLAMLQQVVPMLDQGATIELNTGGGEVIEAIDIYNYLKVEVAKKSLKCHISGYCASAGTIILGAFPRESRSSVAGGERLMFHLPNITFQGELHELIDTAEAGYALQEQMMRIYEEAYSLSGQEFLDSLISQPGDRWLSAEEARDKGFISEVLPAEKSQQVAVVASIDFNKLNKTMPKTNFLDRLLANNKPAVKNNVDTNVSAIIEVTNASGEVFRINTDNTVATVGDEIIDSTGAAAASQTIVSQEGLTYTTDAQGLIIAIARRQQVDEEVAEEVEASASADNDNAGDQLAELRGAIVDLHAKFDEVNRNHTKQITDLKSKIAGKPLAANLSKQEFEKEGESKEKPFIDYSELEKSYQKSN